MCNFSLPRQQHTDFRSMCFFQTKPSSPTDKYGLRRKAVMDTFMKNITALPDVDVKFVVGRSPDKDYRKAFAQDYTQNPELYMHLDMEVCFSV